MDKILEKYKGQKQEDVKYDVLWKCTLEIQFY